MHESLARLKTYGGFARRYTRRLLDERRAERDTPILSAPRKPDPAAWSDDRITVAWLGHATILVNFYGVRILTDPALMSRVGVRIPGVTTVGPRRLVAPALRVDEMPELDLVLLSHAHMDHTDLPTLRRLPREASVIVQPGNRDLVERFADVTELAWGEQVEKCGVSITSTEANHWGARTLTDGERGYGGYLIERRSRAILFAGDTAETRAFARLRNKARIDLAIMPIGAYDPYIAVHASPEQAWRMTREAGATYMLPIHHSTFKLSREPTDEPVRRLHQAAGSEAWRIVADEIGATWTLPED